MKKGDNEMKTASQILEEIRKEEREIEALKSKMNTSRERIQWLTREYEVVKQKEATQSLRKTGVQAHKDALQRLEDEYQKLGRKFEAGTIMDFEQDRMEILSREIKQKRQELRGFL